MQQYIIHEWQVPEYPYKGDFVVQGETDYPKRLMQLEEPPFILFYSGDIGLLHSQAISVVGSRKPSEYSLKITRLLVETLKHRYTIISGLGYGIDICAHQHALDFHSIAVIANGMDCYYPKAHERIQQRMSRDHLVISEYPPGVVAQRHHFPFRNRLIACLGQQLYVMSSSRYSGALTTVNEALKLNRDIISLPHPIDDLNGVGCNQLIEDGALMLTNLRDLYSIDNKE